jgi:hypothetical protein
MANAALRGPFGRIPLGSTHINIGYNTENTLVVHEQPLPSLFATINLNGSNYTLSAVRDDGVLINGQPVQPGFPRQLQPGDTIQVQQTNLTYEEERPANSYTPIPPVAPIPAADANPYGDNAYEARGASTPTPYSNISNADQNVTIREDAPARPYFPPGSSTPIPAVNPAYNSSPDWRQSGANRDSYQAQPTLPASSPPPFVPSPGQFQGTPPPQAGQQFPTPPQRVPADPRSRLLRTLLIALTALLVLILIGSAIGFYQLTRPQPVVAVSSQYLSGTTPTGAASTSFHVLGYKFSSNSPITFLLDNNPLSPQPSVRSDDDGNFKADVPVTSNWSVGSHKLTARDSGSYLAKNVADVMIVNPGEASTPGPNGAPPDNARFTLKIKITTVDNPPKTYTTFLTVSNQSGQNSGTVCDPITDTGEPRTTNGTLDNNTTYKNTVTYSCKGSYQAGKFSYTETGTNLKEDFSDGVSCQSTSSFTAEQLTGTFSSGNTASGTYNAPAYPLNCNKGGANPATINTTASNGTWTGTIV